MSDAVLLDCRDGVATVTLNRPDRANTIDAEMCAALAAAVEALAREPALRAVLLQARGRQFCAGGDIRAMVTSAGNIADVIDAVIAPMHGLVLRLATLPMPVVSALNGPISGAGIGLALCADVVLAAESMKLRGGYSAIGLTPDVGSSWFLARRAGPARAKEIFMTNGALSAHQCHQYGIVSEVLADADLDARATSVVTALARGATSALGHIKALVDGALGRSLQEQLDLEHRLIIDSARSADAREGVAAFTEKRAPVFGRGAA